MPKIIVQITWISEEIKEVSTIRSGLPFEHYEEIAGTGVECFSEKHGIPQHLVNVEILVKYIRN